MHINKISILFCIAAWLILLAPVTTFGVPIPALESYSQTAWQNAWEDAWKLAWESAWKSVNTASIPAVESATDNAVSEMTSDMQDELAALDFNIVWGTPFQAATISSTYTDFPDAAVADQQTGYGQLFINTQPADAEIAIRGIKASFTQGMPLAAGTYIVDIHQSGYLAQTRRIELLPDMAATLDISLTPDIPVEIAGQDEQNPDTATQAQLYKNLLTPAAYSDDKQQAKAPESISSSASSSVQTAAGQQTVQPALQPDIAEDPQQAIKLVKGALFVSTEPADAKVRILHIKPIFHQGIQLAPGRYTIDAASEGYERSVATVEIAPDKDTSIHLALEQALPKAKLFVQTQPSGATVRILNIKPVFHQGMELKHGEYLLDAQLDGYKTITRTVELEPGQEKNITLNLPEALPSGRLFVQASPAEAKIRVLDIRPKFRQGMLLEKGEYTIDAQLDGYQTEVRKVSIVPGEDAKISLQLDKASETGKLYVETEPSGARIRILDIRPKFEQGMELDKGEYTIDAQLDGYNTEIRKVSVVPGRDNTIQLSLTKAPEKGKLFVNTDPGDARVRILAIKPVFHQGIELAPGSYTVDASLKGHETAVEKVTITSGQETHISLALSESPCCDTPLAVELTQTAAQTKLPAPGNGQHAGSRRIAAKGCGRL